MTTTNTNPEYKPTTWLEHVQKPEDSTSFNQVHNSIVDILKVTTADELLNNLRAKILDDIMALKVNRLLCLSAIGDNMM